MSQKDPSANRVKETTIAFDDLTEEFSTALDTGDVFMRNTIECFNQTDKDIKIRFASGDTGDNEATIPSGLSRTLKNLKHFGIIECKYVSEPTSGSVILGSW